MYLDSLLNLLADLVGNKAAHERLEVAVICLLLDDLAHAVADGLDLRGLRVGGLLGGVLLPLGETNAEHAEHVAVRGLQVNKSLNQRLPLLDQAAHLVRGHVHA